MKYIRFDVGGFVVWSDDSGIAHSDMAGCNPCGEPISAGFIYFEGNKAVCYGKSVSLGLESKDEDSDKATEFFFGD